MVPVFCLKRDPRSSPCIVLIGTGDVLLADIKQSLYPPVRPKPQSESSDATFPRAQIQKTSFEVAQLVNVFRIARTLPV